MGVKVRSGSIASVNTIISNFRENDEPKISVAADFKIEDKPKPMADSHIMLVSESVASFADKKDFSFNQSFLIHGTDGTYH